MYVVLAGILAAPVVRVRAADIRHGAGGRRPYVRNAELVQTGERGIPIVHLQGEMAGGNGGRLRPFGEVNLAAAQAQLELSTVERRASVQKLGAQDLRVPVSSALAIADLDVDVMDQLRPEHDAASSRAPPLRSLRAAAHKSSSARRARVKPRAGSAHREESHEVPTPATGAARGSATPCARLRLAALHRSNRSHYRSDVSSPS